MYYNDPHAGQQVSPEKEVWAGSPPMTCLGAAHSYHTPSSLPENNGRNVWSESSMSDVQ